MREKFSVFRTDIVNFLGIPKKFLHPDILLIVTSFICFFFSKFSSLLPQLSGYMPKDNFVCVCVCVCPSWLWRSEVNNWCLLPQPLCMLFFVTRSSTKCGVLWFDWDGCLGNPRDPLVSASSGIKGTCCHICFFLSLLKCGFLALCPYAGLASTLLIVISLLLYSLLLWNSFWHSSVIAVWAAKQTIFKSFQVVIFL